VSDLKNYKVINYCIASYWYLATSQVALFHGLYVVSVLLTVFSR